MWVPSEVMRSSLYPSLAIVLKMLMLNVGSPGKSLKMVKNSINRNQQNKGEVGWWIRSNV